MAITEIQQTKAQKSYRKAAEEFRELTDKINDLWVKAGYTGEPVFELLTAAARMALLSQSPDMRPEAARWR